MIISLFSGIPADTKYFSETTSGHTVIMGRKTFESIGHPLPQRRNIVITQDTNYHADSIEVVNSLDEALRLAALEQGRKFEENDEEVEIFIIADTDIYPQAIAKANKIYTAQGDGKFKVEYKK